MLNVLNVNVLEGVCQYCRMIPGIRTTKTEKLNDSPTCGRQKCFDVFSSIRMMDL